MIQLFDAGDIVKKCKDVPCTCTLQFMIRHNKLHMFTNMRSNDAFWGLPHDVFCFTMLQEIVARDLSVELGTYKHAVGSLHLYKRNVDTAERFLAEGWMSTVSMPPMPAGDPWSGISVLLKAESAIREGNFLENGSLGVDEYWADLIRLLQVFRYKKEKKPNPPAIKELRAQMSSEVYLTFIDKVLGQQQ